MHGLYVHIPFCLRKCPYCSFYSVRFEEDTAEKYVQALCRNIEAYEGRGLKADTLYFGGGTPSVLTAEQVGRVVDECRQVFVLDDAEITLEANPCTVDEQKLRQLRTAGVNRISFGIQSADDKRLGFLGRLHDFRTAENAVRAAAAAGFENISGDLMLGTAGENCDSLRASVEALCALPLTHISAYMLKIEEGTPFDTDKVRSMTADDELMSDLYLAAVEQLEKNGFVQYEISNFAKEGYESRHNNKYWLGEEYLGFGAAAHSYFEGVRYCCPPDVQRFIESPLQPKEVTEEAPDRAEEYVLLGLRLSKGISIDRIAELYSPAKSHDLKNAALELAAHGLVRVRENVLSLTAEGFLVSNTIIAKFIDILSC
ncbi:radical SAM family heme chaperone HemW [Ruminococcus sp.]|uniref:radical SAM family heme chaperone HemW n=1 Tax=Ruminococcus sp. TaxID=41978 RepID=UPI0025DEFEE1|nr:radical SAM family heme chaperone HemW [Ruminococcus sp.]MBQ8966218.1 radical SAM family heme chaperone HemW [Ruminococcus sp.]